MHKLVIESIATITDAKINGVALTPTISLNGNLYTPDVIDNAGGLNKSLPLDWEHTDEKVGNVTFSVDPNTHTMYYSGIIESKPRIENVKNGIYKVSIEAGVTEVSQACTKKACYNMPMGIEMEGLGLTATPGVLTTTLNLLESFQDWKKISGICPKCKESIDLAGPQNDAEIFTCKDCGASFPNKELLGAHMTNHESMMKRIKELEDKFTKAFECPKCHGFKKI